MKERKKERKKGEETLKEKGRKEGITRKRIKVNKGKRKK